MDERRELTVIQGEDRFYLSERQEKQVIDTAARYLTKSGIVVNSQTLKSSIGVTLDSLMRGMLAEGRGLLKKNEGLKKIIDRGFELREGIKRQAAGIIGRDIDFPTSAHFGQHAIDLDVYNSAREDVRTFPLNPDVSGAEKLVKEDARRAQIIDKFWERGLEFLPASLVDSARGRDWKDSEKASFVRNIIASYYYGNSFISPIISMDDMETYLAFGKQKGSQSLEPLEEFFRLEDNNGEELLKDMTGQVDELITAHSDLAKDKTLIYRKLNGAFMLLHPYLEETPIVTTIRKEESQMSIWDEGNWREIKGYKVPTRAILILALRQAIARGDKSKIDQFNKGIRAWTRMQREKREKEVSLAAQTVRLNKTKKEFEEIDKADVDLAYLSTLSVLKQDKRSIQSTVGSLRHSMRVGVNAENAEKLRFENARELTSFASMVVDENGRFVMPRHVYLRMLTNRKKSLDISTQMAEGDVKSLEEIIKGFIDICGGERNFMSVISGFNINLPGGSEMYIARIDEILLIMEQVKNSKKDHFFLTVDDRSKDVVVNIARVEVEHLLNDRNYRKNVVGVGSFKRAELVGIKKELEEGVLGSGALNMLSRIYRGKSIHSYREIRRVLKRIMFNESEVISLMYKKGIYSDSSVSLPPEAEQSVGYAMSEFQEAVIANLPENIDEYSDEELGNFMSVSLESIKHLLPKVVNKVDFKVSASELISDTLAKAEGLKEKISAYTEEDRARDERKVIEREEEDLEAYRRQVRNLELFLHFADTSLMDLDRAEGLSLTQFRSQIARRKNLLFHRINRPKYERELEELGEQIVDIDRRIKIRSALDKKKMAEDALAELNKKDEKEDFIAAMTPLGLTQKIAS